LGFVTTILHQFPLAHLFLPHFRQSPDRDKRQVTILDSRRSPEDLTEGEEAVLAVLMTRADAVLSCEDIAKAALDYEELDHWEAENVVRPYVFRLRRKIEDNPSDPKRICTVRGRGYFFSLD
jgi:DNA-binding response OmpR family regulator